MRSCLPYPHGHANQRHTPPPTHLVAGAEIFAEARRRNSEECPRGQRPSNIAPRRRLLGRLSIEVPDHDIVVGSGHETGLTAPRGFCEALDDRDPHGGVPRSAKGDVSVARHDGQSFRPGSLQPAARATRAEPARRRTRKGESAARHRPRSLVGARRVAGRSSASAPFPGCRGAPRSRRRTNSRTASRGRWRACRSERPLPRGAAWRAS